MSINNKPISVRTRASLDNKPASFPGIRPRHDTAQASPSDLERLAEIARYINDCKFPEAAGKLLREDCPPEVKEKFAVKLEAQQSALMCAKNLYRALSLAALGYTQYLSEIGKECKALENKNKHVRVSHFIQKNETDALISVNTTPLAEDTGQVGEGSRSRRVSSQSRSFRNLPSDLIRDSRPHLLLTKLVSYLKQDDFKNSTGMLLEDYNDEQGKALADALKAGKNRLIDETVKNKNRFRTIGAIISRLMEPDSRTNKTIICQDQLKPLARYVFRIRTADINERINRAQRQTGKKTPVQKSLSALSLVLEMPIYARNMVDFVPSRRNLYGNLQFLTELFGKLQNGDPINESEREEIVCCFTPDLQPAVREAMRAPEVIRERCQKADEKGEVFLNAYVFSLLRRQNFRKAAQALTENSCSPEKIASLEDSLKDEEWKFSNEEAYRFFMTMRKILSDLTGEEENLSLNDLNSFGLQYITTPEEQIRKLAYRKKPVGQASNEGGVKRKRDVS